MFTHFFVALLALLFALPATLAYSSEQTPPNTHASPTDLTGLWTGVWSSSVFGDHVTLDISQSGTRISGTLTLGLNCFPSGSVSGTIEGNSFQMQVKSTDESELVYSGSLLDEDSAKGSWSQKSGKCPLSNGEWALNRNS